MATTNTGVCTKCSQTNSYTATRCIDCGTPLPWAAVAAQAQQQANPAPPPLPQNAGQNNAAKPPMVPGQSVGFGAIFKIFFLWIAIIVGGVFLARAIFISAGAMGISFEPAQVRYERTAKEILDSEIKKRGLPYTCTKVTLVNEAGNKYSGVAEFSEGSSIPITAVIDNTERIVVSFVFPLQWFMQTQ